MIFPSVVGVPVFYLCTESVEQLEAAVAALPAKGKLRAEGEKERNRERRNQS